MCQILIALTLSYVIFSLERQDNVHNVCWEIIGIYKDLHVQKQTFALVHRLIHRARKHSANEELVPMDDDDDD